MVKFTSATEEHIDKWNLHDGTYPVALLRQVLSAQECVHMGLFAQLEHMDKLLSEMEELVEPIPVKEPARLGKVGEKYRRTSPEMLERVRFMRSITKQHQVRYYESRIPTRSNLRGVHAQYFYGASAG
jgi:enoyl-CoA hydratase/carnithine racemase